MLIKLKRADLEEWFYKIMYSGTTLSIVIFSITAFKVSKLSIMTFSITINKT